MVKAFLSKTLFGRLVQDALPGADDTGTIFTNAVEGMQLVPVMFVWGS